MGWRLRYQPIHVLPTKTARSWATITAERPESVFQPLFQAGAHHTTTEVIVTTSLRTQKPTGEDPQPPQVVTPFRAHLPFQAGAGHYPILDMGLYRTPTPLMGYPIMPLGLHNPFTPQVFGTLPGSAPDTTGYKAAQLPDLRDKLLGKLTSVPSLQNSTSTSMCPPDPSAPLSSEMSPMDSQEGFDLQGTNQRTSPSPNRMDAHFQHSSSFNGTPGSAPASTWTNWIPNAMAGNMQPYQAPMTTETGNLRISASTGSIAPGPGTGLYPSHPFHWGNEMTTTMPHQFAFPPPILMRVDNQWKPNPGHESPMFRLFM